MSINDPFAKPSSKKSTQIQKSVQKIDTMRENVKKQLMNALEKDKDKSTEGLKFNSEEIAKQIEQIIYEQNDNSSQSKFYRDKIRKLEGRIKGIRNKLIRDILKKGLFSITDFCNLNEKDLNDENFFKKFQTDDNINKNDDKGKKVTKIGPGKGIIRPPPIPRPIIHNIPETINHEIEEKKNEENEGPKNSNNSTDEKNNRHDNNLDKDKKIDQII